MDKLVNVYAQTNPQILGRRLTNARKAAAVTQDEAAKLLGVARSTLVAIEQGSRLPKEEELFRLAERYGAPLHSLLRKEPPPEPLQVQFRAAPRVGAKLDRKVEQSIEELQQLCDDYFELERLCKRNVPATNAPVYSVDGMPAARAGEDIAQTERNRLGLGDAPVLNVLEVVENEGVSVFQMKLPSHVSGLYGNAVQHKGPKAAQDAEISLERAVMVINVDHPAERRRWSIMHEYAHFLTRRHTAEVIIDFEAQITAENERFADAFASAFLMPSSSVSRRFRELKQERTMFMPPDLCLLAHFFAVSVDAMARRLEGLGLIRQGSYQRMLDAGFRPMNAQQLLGLVPHAMDNRLLPLRFQFLASEAFQAGAIAEEEYAEFLRQDLLTLRRRHMDLRVNYMMTELGKVQPTGAASSSDVGA